MNLRKWLTDRTTTVLPIVTAGKDRFLAFLSICTLAHNTRTDCTLSLLKNYHLSDTHPRKCQVPRNPEISSRPLGLVVDERVLYFTLTIYKENIEILKWIFTKQQNRSFLTIFNYPQTPSPLAVLSPLLARSTSKFHVSAPETMLLKWCNFERLIT